MYVIKKDGTKEEFKQERRAFSQYPVAFLRFFQ